LFWKNNKKGKQLMRHKEKIDAKNILGIQNYIADYGIDGISGKSAQDFYNASEDLIRVSAVFYNKDSYATSTKKRFWEIVSFNSLLSYEFIKDFESDIEWSHLSNGRLSEEVIKIYFSKFDKGEQKRIIANNIEKLSESFFIEMRDKISDFSPLTLIPISEELFMNLNGKLDPKFLSRDLNPWLKPENMSDELKLFLRLRS
jgi:hypothetical protein